MWKKGMCCCGSIYRYLDRWKTNNNVYASCFSSERNQRFNHVNMLVGIHFCTLAQEINGCERRMAFKSSYFKLLSVITDRITAHSSDLSHKPQIVTADLTTLPFEVSMENF